MDILAKKIELTELLLKVKSETLIHQIENLLRNELVVGYSTDGKPLTLKDYNKRLEIAEKQIKENKTTGHESLGEQMDTW